MARSPKKSDADWLDALKLAMQVDPGLRKQREESEARDRVERDRVERDRAGRQPAPGRPPAGPRPPRDGGPVDHLHDLDPGDDPGTDPSTVVPAPAIGTPPVVAEFPWEKPVPPREPGIAPTLSLNFRAAPVDEPPPPAPIPMPRPEPVPSPAPLHSPAVVIRPSVKIPDRVEPDRPPEKPVAGRPYLARPVANASAIRLTAAVEPLLQLVCRLNRMKRTGVLSDKFRPESLRVEFETALAQVDDAGDVGTDLAKPLRAFADVLMTRAGFPFARRWVPLTEGPVPPERVFQQAATDAVADVTGRDNGTWAVYYACLCLMSDLIPAAGNLPSGTELLDELDAGIYTKPGERYDRVCPQAYEGVFDQPLLPSVGRRLRSVAVASVLFLLVAVAIAVALNVLYLRQMDDSIARFRHGLNATPAAVPANESAK